MHHHTSAPKNKSDFFPRWKALEFGNRIGMWDSVESLLDSGYGGSVTMRAKQPGGPCLYRVNVSDVPEQVRRFEQDFVFNESAPDDELTWQGELMHTSLLGGYYLYGSTEKKPMRQALAASGIEHRGLAALGRVKAYANQNGYDMLMELLDLYEGAVIEFSCYSRAVGVMPRNNVLVWEVRNY